MREKDELLVNREFSFTRRDFDKVTYLINHLAGINLTERKTDMVYSRLARRIRKLGMGSFENYLKLVENDEAETINFINALTTNLTHFFREGHHFEYLKDIYFPELFARKKKRIRFWSAGCSTGEEPYTLSMVWHAIPNKSPEIDFKILATDLDTNVLEVCRKGIYSEEKLKPISEEYRKWFKQTSDCKRGEFQVHPKLRKNIYFKPLNLMGDWPMRGPFELIICRNVLIYFDKSTQIDLVSRFAELLSDNGCLMLGHSENLSTGRSIFQPIGRTIYRKV